MKESEQFQEKNYYFKACVHQPLDYNYITTIILRELSYKSVFEILLRLFYAMPSG